MFIYKIKEKFISTFNTSTINKLIILLTKPSFWGIYYTNVKFQKNKAYFYVPTIFVKKFVLNFFTFNLPLNGLFVH